jgi:hypothetical protein
MITTIRDDKNRGIPGIGGIIHNLHGKEQIAIK